MTAVDPAGARPRCRQHTFAHVALRQVALRDGRKFVRMLALPDGPRLVRELWDEVGLRCAAKGHPPVAGEDRPQLEATTLDGRQAVIVRMPDTVADEEAEVAVVVESDSTPGVRYFLVERLGDGLQLTEWRPIEGGARRGVWGPIEDVDTASLDQALTRSRGG